MKAPKYQHAEILDAALQVAVQTLDDPVEGLEITGKGVVAWAGGRFILISYQWNQGYGEDRALLIGSGDWSADYAGDCDASFRSSFGRPPSVRAWWRHLIG